MWFFKFQINYTTFLSVKEAGIYLQISLKIQSFRVDYPVTHRPTNMMDHHHPYIDRDGYFKKRTLSGTVAIFVFLLAVILILVAFATPYWLESDKRIVGSKFEKLGLWTHCFRSLPDPYDPAMGRFFSGCRWIFDPFTTGYQEIRSFLVPRKAF